MVGEQPDYPLPPYPLCIALDYTSFQAEDFVLDDSFQAYATGTDAAAAQFWQGWLAAHPPQQPAAERARQLVVALGQAQARPVASQQIEADVQRLHRAMRRPAAAPQLRTRRRKHLLASLLTLLIMLGVGYWLWPPYGLAPVRYATGAGQRRTVRLPDGSVVVLNGNSRLTTAATWNAQVPREVWLEGEAYFQVRHLSRVPGQAIRQAGGNAKFIVHAGRLEVAVLGTTFNVLNRSNGLNRVTLNSGRVLVDYPTLLGHEAALMAPNELVEVSAQGHRLRKSAVVAARYSAWVGGTLHFDHTPLSDIIYLLHDTYGLNITVADPVLLRQTVTGSLPSQNTDILLQTLAESLGMRAERSGQNVRLLPLRLPAKASPDGS
ncbi:hypothetical protein A0257_18385 [Hymenobacter psoromatis]|nr:hypothetical protein A0257_18385 [Hymenobacter psoromatis]